MTLQAPFPWFGGKSRVAPLVWDRFGNVPNYVEPFAGSLAVLLGRPHAPGLETVNDLDGFIANFWRAVAADPDEVAQWADWPVNENDQHARHVWLVERCAMLTARLEGDPTYYDAQIAGWWVWGIGCWIGSGWCSGKGTWQAQDGQLVKTEPGAGDRGVHRQLVHLGTAGQGVHRQRVHLGDAGQGVHRQRVTLRSWFRSLQDRLRRVRVCSGDWRRVCGPSPTTRQGLTGVFLDPPYGKEATRAPDLYATDSLSVADAVRAWAVEHGSDPLLRMALCGYTGEHDDLADRGWTCDTWKTQGGYANLGDGQGRLNASREVIWWSPACLPRRQPRLW